MPKGGWVFLLPAKCSCLMTYRAGNHFSPDLDFYVISENLFTFIKWQALLKCKVYILVQL